MTTVRTVTVYYCITDLLFCSGNILHRFRRSDGGSSEAIHYVLQQDDADDIRRGYIGFHWAFEGGCRLLQAPAAVHVTDIF